MKETLKTSKQKSNLEYFSDACRCKTGTHFLDSGGVHGRHWQNPRQPKDMPPVTVDDYGATINTAHFLAEHMEVERQTQDEFFTWAALPENEKLSWFEAGERYATEVLCLTQSARDNTCNNESDLSQVYIWEVYNLEEPSDWIFADEDTLVLIYVHTGADVRGGYAYPVFCKPRGEYSIPVDLCADYIVVEERNTGKELFEICDNWRQGYSSYPFGEVESDCKRLFFFCERKPNEFTAALKDGGAVRVFAEYPYCC